MDDDGNFKAFNPHDYGDGLKIMEHSWVGNEFVATICHMIGNGTYRVAWMGDYNDEAEGLLDDEQNEWRLQFWKAVDDASDSADWCRPGLNTLMDSGGYYLINMTKKEQCYVPMKKKEEWIIHPLPLLTSCAGSGGGDYCGELNRELIGAWAFDVVTWSPFRCGYDEDEWIDLNEEYGNILFEEE